MPRALCRIRWRPANSRNRRRSGAFVAAPFFLARPRRSAGASIKYANAVRTGRLSVVILVAGSISRGARSFIVIRNGFLMRKRRVSRALMAFALCRSPPHKGARSPASPHSNSSNFSRPERRGPRKESAPADKRADVRRMFDRRKSTRQRAARRYNSGPDASLLRRSI